MILSNFASIAEVDSPLELVDLPVPEPKDREVLIKVSTCGVCHTDLDIIEGRVKPPKFPVIPGHQVIGRVAALGKGTRKHREGDRVGVGWIHHSSGEADENLSPEFHSTGCDADGGYAEYLVVPEDYAYRIPEIFPDAGAAPLLCAGAIGYRSLNLAKLQNGQRLGLAGFGGSAHLVLPLARKRFPESKIFVFARGQQSRDFARELGADWAGDFDETPPHPLDAIIDTTPAWNPVIASLRNLSPGGRLVINAIRKENKDKDALLKLNYHTHLWMEREVKSVANITGRDIADFLPIAAEIPLQPKITTHPLEKANQAIVDLKRKPVRGTKVLVVSEEVDH